MQGQGGCAAREKVFFCVATINCPGELWVICGDVCRVRTILQLKSNLYQRCIEKMKTDTLIRMIECEAQI